MADIRKMYFDLVSDIYPYAECYDESPNGKETESEMLYNLINMRNDFVFPVDDDMKTDFNRINTLIDIFTSLSIKPERN